MRRTLHLIVRNSMHVDNSFQGYSKLILETKELDNFVKNFGVGTSCIVETWSINNCNQMSAYVEADNLAGLSFCLLSEIIHSEVCVRLKPTGSEPWAFRNCLFGKFVDEKAFARSCDAHDEDHAIFCIIFEGRHFRSIFVLLTPVCKETEEL